MNGRFENVGYGVGGQELTLDAGEVGDGVTLGRKVGGKMVAGLEEGVR